MICFSSLTSWLWHCLVSVIVAAPHLLWPTNASFSFTQYRFICLLTPRSNRPKVCLLNAFKHFRANAFKRDRSSLYFLEEKPTQLLRFRHQRERLKKKRTCITSSFLRRSRGSSLSDDRTRWSSEKLHLLHHNLFVGTDHLCLQPVELELAKRSSWRSFWNWKFCNFGFSTYQREPFNGNDHLTWPGKVTNWSKESKWESVLFQVQNSLKMHERRGGVCCIRRQINTSWLFQLNSDYHTLSSSFCLSWRKRRSL